MMQTQKIIRNLQERGWRCCIRWTDAGMEVGIYIGQGKTLCGLVPIDDESDDRFVDFLDSEARKSRGYEDTHD